MKTQIRSGVFETNSSSIHSIAIKRKSYEEGLESFKKWLSDPVLVFDLGEFGWAAKKYTTPASRASYLWTMACSDTIKEATRRKSYIESVLKEVGVSCRFQKVTAKKYEDGYECCVAEDDSWFGIDHSDEWQAFKELVFRDKDLLLDFLFGDSYILTYNDNDDYDYWLYSVDDGVKRDTWTKGN